MEYKYGLGRDRRVLGYSSSKEWMRLVVTPKQKVRRGMANGNCKLTDEQIFYIREHKEQTGPFLAKMFGITKAHVYRIQKRRTRI